jgi:hypothetical protein
MVQLARLVRWWFGIQALIVVSVVVLLTGSIAWSLIRHTPTAAQRPHKVTSTTAAPRALPELPYGIPFSRSTVLLFVAVVVASCLASTVAWWALRKGWRSARFWALSASALSLWDLGLGTLCGVAGLIVFWRKDVVAAMATAGPGAAKVPERVPGDGTSKVLDIGAQVIALVAFFAASYYWAKWASHLGLIRHEGMLREVEFFGALYCAVLLHELGHFLAGLGSDMTLRAFMVGPLAGEIRSGRWKFSLNPMGFIGGGQVAMVPLHLRELRGRFAYVAVAGPLFSLITGMIALIGALTAPGSAWEGAWRFLALTGSMCLIDFVINLMPLRAEGAYSDGARIVQMVKGGHWADEYSAFSMVASSLVSDLRPRQYDLPLLERVAAFHQTGEKGAQVRLFMALHFVETGRAAEAAAAWREAARLHPEASADGSAEYAFMEATVAGNVEQARAWWRRVEAKGDSKREVDYWRGLAAVLTAEGNREGAREALDKADACTRRLPIVGAYEYDRWSLDVIRKKLAEEVVAPEVQVQPALA